ncbi:hypothetical protein R50073_27550 [Maricurvus nonylphenolicus]|uniref:PA3496 family putative envelope integrity protein n=1 Tax=Maricurvus nonylphenolicus TaxID=1008307 RepID=UPI0036F2ED8E
MSTAVLTPSEVKPRIPVESAPVKPSRPSKSADQLDARRRLEEKLEDRRLSRELKEFEFDL